MLIGRKLPVCENWYNFGCNFNLPLIGLKTSFKNWEKAKNAIFPAKLMLHRSFFISPEIDRGSEEKQDIYFYWPYGLS